MIYLSSRILNVTANRAGSYPIQKLNGRDHYVVPVTMIVPGVLSGSHGALFYAPEDIAKNYNAWDGMPLVVNHPLRNGNPISARNAAVLEAQGIGVVLRSRVTLAGKLVAEGWFDIEKTRRVDQRVLNALQRGEQIELSTGLFTDNIPVKNGSHHNGKPYTHLATNLRPDHLAILPDQLGACSITDGCGVGVLNTSQRKRESIPLIPPKMIW